MDELQICWEAVENASTLQAIIAIGGSALFLLFSLTKQNLPDWAKKAGNKVIGAVKK